MKNLLESQDERVPRRSNAVVAGLVVLTLGGITAIFFLFTLGFAGHSPALSGVCGTCHEMRPWVSSWKGSLHARVGCYSCHDAHYEWYDVSHTLLGERSMLRHAVATRTEDIRRHLAGEYSSIGTATATAHIPMASYDMVCLDCHVLTGKRFFDERVIIDHEEHALRNDSCLSCHLATTHPTPDEIHAVLNMEQCFSCHDVRTAAGSPGTCDTCHPVGFELVPISHGVASWDDRHGAEALAGRDRCSMCHESPACHQCHAIDMPHPADWTDADIGHAARGTSDPELCSICHPSRPDPCYACHHEGYDFSAEPWETGHVELVRNVGVPSCWRCHWVTFCRECHE